MRMWAVCKREFAAFFLTPVGYVVLAIYALITGFGFSANFLMYVEISQSPAQYAYASVPDFEEYFLSPFLVFCGLLIMFLAPLITMRLLAEERHRGTIELLLTQPLRDRDIIFGKFLACVGMILVMMSIVAVDLAVVAWFVRVEWPVLIYGLLTVLLIGASFMALGLFVSAIAPNQIISAALSFGLSMLLYIVGNMGGKLNARELLPETWPAALRMPLETALGALRRLVQELAIDAHANDMAQGIFRPQDVAYYLLFTAFFLFLCFRALESRSWRARG
jgi:ABC-2 type transport system permease protein